MKTNMHNYSNVARLVVALLTFAQLIVLIFIEIIVPIDYDTSYNMQIVENLRTQGSYATHGVLSGGQTWLFDPYITTGPFAMLLMYGIHLFFDSSIVAIKVYSVAVLVILFVRVLQYYSNNKEEAIYYVASIMMMLSSANAISNPLQFVGEPISTVLIIVFMNQLDRRFFRNCGLVMGLIVQTKLSVGVVMLFVFTPLIVYQNRNNVSRIISYLGCCVCPTVVFIIFIWSQSDTPLLVLSEFVFFIKSQARANSLQYNIIKSAETVVNCIPDGLILLFFISIISYILSIKINFSGSAIKEEINTAVRQIKIKYINSILLAIVVIIVNNTNNIGYRTVFIALVLIVPKIVIDNVSHLHRYKISSVLISVLLIMSIFNSVKTANQINNQWSLIDQINVSEYISQQKYDSMFVNGWWQNPEVLLLTDIPGIPKRTGSNQALIIQKYQSDLQKDTLAERLDLCADNPRIMKKLLVCRMIEPPPTELTILRAGSGRERFRNMRWGVVLEIFGNEFWVEVNKVDFSLIGPMRIFVNNRRGPLVMQHANGTLITGGIPLNYTWGEKIIHLRLQSTVSDDSWEVGTFSVWNE